jgi:hypothetical protein
MIVHSAVAAVSDRRLEFRVPSMFDSLEVKVLFTT